MNTYLKVIAGTLTAVLLCLQLNKQQKDYALILVIFTCCMVIYVAADYLSSVIRFFQELEQLTNLDSSMLKILLKAVGVGLLSEITCLFCTDSGNAALGKSVQFFASCVILWMSIPLFNELLDLIKTILVAV